MAKFAVGDVVRVLSNETRNAHPLVDGGVFYNAERLNDLVGTVQQITAIRKDYLNYYQTPNTGGNWLDLNQSELATFQVGDKVVCEEFVGKANDPYFNLVLMNPLIGKVGEVVEKRQFDNDWIRVKHPDADYSYVWPFRAVKFHLEGDVAVAPQKAAVGAAKPLAKPVKAKPKKPAIIKVKNMRAEMNKKAAAKPGVASYALQRKDGSVRWQIADICHARIGKNDYQDKSPIVKVATAVKPFYDKMKGKQQKDYEHYVEYITKRSVFADCFLPCSSPTRYSVYMNLKRSVHNVAAAAIALREGSEEYGGKVRTFVFLVKQGFDEDTAWVVSRFFHPNGADDKGTYSFCSNSGHDTITAATPEKNFFKVFTDGLYMNDKPYGQEDGRYQVYACFGGTDAYGGGGKDALSVSLKKHSNYVNVGAGWNAREQCDLAGLLAVSKWVAEQILAAKAARAK